MAKKFYVSIGAIICAEGKALALHKERFSDGTPCDLWTLPGGKMDEGETPTSCLFRELKEEIGLVNVTVEPRFVGSYIDPDAFPDGTGIVILKYRLDLPQIFTPTLDAEHSRFEWLPWDEFLELEFHNKKVAMKDMIFGFAKEM